MSEPSKEESTEVRNYNNFNTDLLTSAPLADEEIMASAHPTTETGNASDNDDEEQIKQHVCQIS